ncbi:GntR family transcriptional regulator [Streptomyces sp. NPDC056460]|uniref:GntR family transcriptional regulator n=1 Tax=Streptomyces sp. NPDC056460 TaxID=3345825 RepID=UPI0036839BF3
MSEVSPRGTYLLIAEALRRDVEASPAGRTLPSEAALMQAHAVSRNTVRRALKVLEASKLIVPVPGVGWQVSKEPMAPLVDRLKLLIIDDALHVGDVYPSESKLCARFGASRTAVRRALAQMEGTGLVAAIHGKGRIVCALPASSERP